MLAFITPESPLFPGAAYTVSLSGLTDTSNDSLADSSISFSTAHARAPIQGFDDEEWIPDTRSGQGNWQSGRSASAWQSLPPLQAPLGVTALAGQVLTLNGNRSPMSPSKSTTRRRRPINTGRFLLVYLSQGHHELLMDGRTASRGAKTYGVFESRNKDRRECDQHPALYDLDAQARHRSHSYRFHLDHTEVVVNRRRIFQVWKVSHSTEHSDLRRGQKPGDSAQHHAIPGRPRRPSPTGGSVRADLFYDSARIWLCENADYGRA